MCRWAAYIGAPIFLEEIISRPGPDEDWAVVSGTDISPDEPNASIAEAELERIS